MTNFRKELEEVLVMEKEIGGFHYVLRARQLHHQAKTARNWKYLAKMPVWRWPHILADTRYVLDTLTDMGVAS